jgi:hypothetical protein
MKPSPPPTQVTATGARPGMLERDIRLRAKEPSSPSPVDSAEGHDAGQGRTSAVGTKYFPGFKAVFELAR